jgi:hypothetical protein
MAWYSQDDEIRNLHLIKKVMFNLVFRESDDKNREQEIEAAKAYAQLARLQAELQGKLIRQEPPASTSSPA